MVPALDVYDASFGGDVLVGRARFSLRRGMVSTTFSYDESYVARRDARPLDPGLPLSVAPIHCPGLPGSFRDSSPDRWGRRLIDRAMRDQATSLDVPLRQFDEVDYLTGVLDQTREGALRFCFPGGQFLASSAPVPPMVQLPELMDAARSVVADEAGHAQIKELLDAGSGSLGGARPKASVRDGDKLLLAKFSHAGDEWDVIAWEKTALDMASAAGIEAPESRLVRIGGESVLLLDRFDREASCLEGPRIGFISGMTLLGSSDGEQRDYAELAEAIALYCEQVSNQLAALFRRVAFSVAIGNTDDHLRNWGFLRRGSSWRLSPIYDINPNLYEGAQRAMLLVGESGPREAEGLRDLAAYAGLSLEKAAEIVAEVLASTAMWQTRARANGIAEREISQFEPLFKKKTNALRKAFAL